MYKSLTIISGKDSVHCEKLALKIIDGKKSATHMYHSLTKARINMIVVPQLDCEYALIFKDVWYKEQLAAIMSDKRINCHLFVLTPCKLKQNDFTNSINFNFIAL